MGPLPQRGTDTLEVPFAAHELSVARDGSDPRSHPNVRGVREIESRKSHQRRTIHASRGYAELTNPFFKDQDIRSLRIADVQNLHSALLEGKRPLSPRSVDMVLSTLGRILSYAEVQEIVTTHAVVAWKRTRGRRRSSNLKPISRAKALDSNELRHFLSIAEARFPNAFPFILFLADTGARLGEATALRWIDVDLANHTARITRSLSNGKHLSLPKTRRERTVELSARLVDVLAERKPDLFGDDDLVFPNEAGGFIDPHNFRDRIFRPIARKAFGKATE